MSVFSHFHFREDHWKEIVKTELVDRVITALGYKMLISNFIDISKAFGILKREILLYKLQYYWISDVAID